MRCRITPRMVTGQRKRHIFPVFIYLGRQTMSISSSWPRPCHLDCVEVLISSFLPGMFMARARTGLGPEGPGLWGPPLVPHLGQQLLASGKDSLGSAFVFPTPITFAEVLPAPSASGHRRQPPPAPHKDDNRHRSPGEGGSGGRRAGQRTQTPPRPPGALP
jgi:hypothetical protein